MDRLMDAFDDACRDHDLAACTDMGVLLADGKKPPVDKSLAVLRQACGDGDKLACMNAEALDPRRLGWGRPAMARHAELDGTRRKSQSACERLEAMACGQVGLMIEFGLVAGMEKNEAGGFYDKACKGGVKKACGRGVSLNSNERAE